MHRSFSSVSRVVFMVAVIAALAANAQPGGMMQAPTVGAEKVVETADREIRHYTGQVTAITNVSIVSRVPGEIVEIGFKEGQLVKKGQMLYKLDDVQYAATVKGAEAMVEKCQAEFTYAQNNYKRIDELYRKDAYTLDEMENARATFGAARGALANAQATLITAQDNLKHTTITAPQDGMIGTTNVHVGDYVSTASGTLLTVIQTQPIRVKFALSTADLRNLYGNADGLKKNGIVTLSYSDGTTYEETGAIELLNNLVNSRTDTIQVYANFPNAKLQLLPGATLTVTLSMKEPVTCLAVSPSAVMYDARGAFVYIIGEKNIIEKRYVTLGNATNTQQMILHGVKKGETVVVKGTHKVYVGAPVEVTKD